MDVGEEISEFEMLRDKSVKFFNDFVLEEMSKSDVAESVKSLNNLAKKKEPKPKTATKKKANTFRVSLKWLLPERRKSSRLAKINPASYVETDSNEENKENKSDEEYEGMVFKKRRSAPRKTSVPLLTVGVIDPDYIENVCYHVSSKIYSSTEGTSCHQCRQKTLDSKTICKSGRCVGVRGQFCGVCLLNRYGEHADEALRNRTWSCPPCRGICNCSICRTRNGKRPTGILTPIAHANGHKSVKDYLISLKGLDRKLEDAGNIEYLPGDVLGFTEQGDVWSIPNENDDVMGFQNNIATTVTPLTEPNLARFNQLLRELEADK